MIKMQIIKIHRSTFCGWLILCLFVPLCYARTQRLSGRVFAYDPAFHTFKQSSFVENQEVVIFQLSKPRHGQKYIKVVFKSFGPKQINAKTLEGYTVVTVNGTRDTTCDQGAPEFVTDAAIPSQSGRFQLAKLFREQSKAEISHLECYLVQAGED